MPPEKPQWAELFTEVVTSGLCTGCSACVIVLPLRRPRLRRHRGRLQALPRRRRRRARQLHPRPEGLHPVHPGLPALPDLGARDRDPPVRPAPDRRRGLGHRPPDACWPGPPTPTCRASARTAGLVSALLIWALEHDVIDAALVSGLEGDGSTWKAVPQVARNREDVLATAGSRYTYSANPLAYPEAIAGGAERIALVGHGLPGLGATGHGRPARRARSPGASPSRSGCCARRRSTTPSSPSSSRPSTGWPGPTSSR